LGAKLEVPFILLIFPPLISTYGKVFSNVTIVTMVSSTLIVAPVDGF